MQNPGCFFPSSPDARTPLFMIHFIPYCFIIYHKGYCQVFSHDTSDGQLAEVTSSWSAENTEAKKWRKCAYRSETVGTLWFRYKPGRSNPPTESGGGSARWLGGISKLPQNRWKTQSCYGANRIILVSISRIHLKTGYFQTGVYQ